MTWELLINIWPLMLLLGTVIGFYIYDRIQRRKDIARMRKDNENR